MGMTYGIMEVSVQRRPFPLYLFLRNLWLDDERLILQVAEMGHTRKAAPVYEVVTRKWDWLWLSGRP